MASIHERPVSSFPISISTSLSLETLFDGRLPAYDPDRPIPKRANLSDYQTAWINLWTLYRNLMTSVDKDTFFTTSEDSLADVLASEVEVIESLFRIEGHNVCQPLFYLCSYKDLTKLDQRVKLREDKTELQIAHKVKYEKTIKKLQSRIHCRLLNTNIMPDSRTSSLILTHVPYDLLSYTNFSKLELLESNTGRIKTRQEWNSKYYPVAGSDMSHLPFLKMLLLVFGDKVLIHPAVTKLRQQILQIAEERHWTPATTIQKVLFDIDLSKCEPYVKQYLANLK